MIKNKKISDKNALNGNSADIIYHNENSGESTFYNNALRPNVSEKIGFNIVNQFGSLMGFSHFQFLRDQYTFAIHFVATCTSRAVLLVLFLKGKVPVCLYIFLKFPVHSLV